MIFGLLGNQIAYTKSPKLHQLLAEYLKLEYEYQCFDIEEDEIEELMHQLRESKIQGLNVTKPYKEVVMSYVDVLTDRAKHIKAVNTIYMKDHQLIGDNTDYEGFSQMILMQNIELDLPIYVMGTGGASKMVQYYLKEHNIPFKLLSRRESLSYRKVDSEPGILINTTPVGSNPLLTKQQVEKKIVIDLNYKIEPESILVHAAKRYDGIDMLIYQAIAAQEIWQKRKIEWPISIIDQIKEQLK